MKSVGSGKEKSSVLLQERGQVSGRAAVLFGSTLLSMIACCSKELCCLASTSNLACDCGSFVRFEIAPTK